MAETVYSGTLGSNMEIKTTVIPKQAREWVKLCGERSPVLAEIELHVFRGATLYTLQNEGHILSYNVTRFGKRKKNIWEPYANWYTAYTIPNERRKGYARQLMQHIRILAIRAGCRRLKARAGTMLGLLLHVGMGDELWGVTEELDVLVDTPLVRLEEYRGRKPPNSIPSSGMIPWSLGRVLEALAERPMRYEKKPPAK
jgi:GNAT superfamily N-acetyltransferase